MALDDAGLSSAIQSATLAVHTSPGAQAAFGNAIKNYAAGATLSVSGSSYTAPAGPVTGSASATPTFTGATLDSGLVSAFGSSHTRSQAASMLASAIQNYAKTGAATVTSAGLTTSAGPVIGSTSTLSPTFDDATLASSIAQLFAQDNSAAFFATGFSSAIATYFKSGRFPTPASPGFTAPIPAGGFGPVTGTASGTIS